MQLITILIILNSYIPFSGQMSKLSPENSRFYQPLISTLDKSRVKSGLQTSQISINPSRNHHAAQSRISMRMRSLSPQQADNIRKETYIPFDKQLVPTSNLWKIRGKQFTAIDVSTRQGPPVPLEVIRAKSRNGPIIQETLYEFQAKSNNTHFSYPPQVQQRQQVQAFRPSSIITSQQQPSRISSSPQVLINPVKLKDNFSISQKNGAFLLKQPQPLQLMSSARSKKSVFINQENNRVKREPIPLLKERKQMKEKTINPYKYNLFSSFDELINTGCKTCGSNEIVATKPKYSDWN